MLPPAAACCTGQGADGDDAVPRHRAPLVTAGCEHTTTPTTGHSSPGWSSYLGYVGGWGLCDLPTSPSDIASSGQVSPDGHIGYHQASVRYTGGGREFYSVLLGAGRSLPNANGSTFLGSSSPLSPSCARMWRPVSNGRLLRHFKVLPRSCCPAAAVAVAGRHRTRGMSRYSA